MESTLLLRFPTSVRYILLAIASILTGMLAGFIGYWLGQYFYVPFLYPFILLVIGLILYFPSLRFFGTSSSLFNAFCGFLLGLMILLAFHYVGYSLFREKNINTFEISSDVDQSTASQAVDSFLQKETGWGGFGGFIKYENSQMNPYVFYVLRSGRVAHTYNIYLHGRTGWAYLAGEAAVLSIGSALIGFFSRKFFL